MAADSLQASGLMRGKRAFARPKECRPRARFQRSSRRQQTLFAAALTLHGRSRVGIVSPLFWWSGALNLDEEAVRAANQVFYRAFESLDLAVMAGGLWRMVHHHRQPQKKGVVN